jgi:hypothetical protein
LPTRGSPEGITPVSKTRKRAALAQAKSAASSSKQAKKDASALSTDSKAKKAKKRPAASTAKESNKEPSAPTAQAAVTHEDPRLSAIFVAGKADGVRMEMRGKVMGGSTIFIIGLDGKKFKPGDCYAIGHEIKAWADPKISIGSVVTKGDVVRVKNYILNQWRQGSDDIRDILKNKRCW